MSGIEYGLGRFADTRLEKGGPICMPRWLRGLARVFANSRSDAGRERFNSHAFCATMP
jgi:hypothetical protein